MPPKPPATVRIATRLLGESCDGSIDLQDSLEQGGCQGGFRRIMRPTAQQCAQGFNGEFANELRTLQSRVRFVRSTYPLTSAPPDTQGRLPPSPSPAARARRPQVAGALRGVGRQEAAGGGVTAADEMRATYCSDTHSCRHYSLSAPGEENRFPYSQCRLEDRF
jgi:hypothetical protein